MAAKENPFKTSMQTMRFPPDKSVICIAGHQLEADEYGEVEVPKEYVDVLTQHGLVAVEPMPAAAPVSKRLTR